MADTKRYPGMRDVPLRDRAVFGAVFFLRHWFPRSEHLRRRKEMISRRIVDHVRRSGKSRVLEVERRRDLSAAEFRGRYLRRGIPVVLEGAGRDWKCTREWSFDNFQTRFGRETIKLVQ